MAKSKPKPRHRPAPRGPAEICHIEIPAPDVKKAVAFYTKLFRWKVSTAPGMEDYPFWSTRGACGAFNATAVPAPGGAVLVLKVPEINAAMKRIVQAGGRQVRPKTALPAGLGGHYAYFDDPNGVRMGLWSRV